MELNLRREKYDATKAPSSASHVLFTPELRGVEAFRTRPDEDVDLVSDFSGEAEEGEERGVNNPEDEIDELRRVTYEQGLKEEEEGLHCHQGHVQHFGQEVQRSNLGC